MAVRPMRRGSLVLFWLAMASLGCTQNDVGGGVVDFEMPKASFFISSGASEPRWRDLPPGGIPNVLCSGPAALTDDCCHPPAAAGSLESIDCQQYPLRCDLAGWCALVFDFDDEYTIELGTRELALKERRGWVLAHANLAVIESTVDLNNLPIESAALYVAPQGVLSPRSDASRFLSAIPLNPSSSVALGADAQRVLSGFLADFNTPFNLILTARIAIEAQDTGMDKPDWDQEERTASFTIGGRVHASF
jgi:hypothetical protein